MLLLELVGKIIYQAHVEVHAQEEVVVFFFFQAEDGIRDADVTGVQTCALPISVWARSRIADLMGLQVRGERPERTEEITELALAHHLMSAYTAFVVVDASRVT